MTFATSSPGASTAGQGTTPVIFFPYYFLTQLLSTRDCFSRHFSHIMQHANAIQQPICQNCTTSTTPLWRRDESGSVLCNACGLFLKLHGRPRPISLKTDVIKSRNRVKNSGQPAKKKVSDACIYVIFIGLIVFTESFRFSQRYNEQPSTSKIRKRHSSPRPS